MRVLNCVNVNDGYVDGFHLVSGSGWLQETRAGPVYSLQEPLAVVYAKPQQRVLFGASRDANPFFFLFEALWLLAGRNDAKWLDRFVGDFSSRFAEASGILHGSYGFRWRHHFDAEWGGLGVLDQLNTVVRLLEENSGDRRVVIQMWDPMADLGVAKKDVPCNLTVVPRVRHWHRSEHNVASLDITVFNRSNDIVWGLFGANAVQFSFLQEYLAGRLGLEIGTYTQISTNAHLYQDHEEKYLPDVRRGLRGDYPETRSIGLQWDKWDEDLLTFMEWTEDWEQQPPTFPHNPWFENTASPLFAAHALWKHGDRSAALELLSDPVFDIAPDWRMAAKEWMLRRMTKERA